MKLKIQYSIFILKFKVPPASFTLPGVMWIAPQAGRQRSDLFHPKIDWFGYLWPAGCSILRSQRIWYYYIYCTLNIGGRWLVNGMIIAHIKTVRHSTRLSSPQAAVRCLNQTQLSSSQGQWPGLELWISKLWRPSSHFTERGPTFAGYAAHPSRW